MVNAAGMSNFLLTFGGCKAQVVSVDGQWVQPLATEDFWIAPGQRADFILKIPKQLAGKSTPPVVVPLLALEEGMSPAKRAGVVLYRGGERGRKAAVAKAASLSVCGDKAIGFMDFKHEEKLSAFHPFSFTEDQVDVTYNVTLSSRKELRLMNDHTFVLPPQEKYTPNAQPLLLRYGQKVKLNIQNMDADNHSMHLHGHLFQVVSIDGAPVDGAVRDTVLLPAGCHNVTVLFEANNPGNWAFHCHMVFHMAMGMMTTVEYIG